MKLKHLDLFSGIGGFSLGLESTGGFETVAFCDYDSYCQKVLRKHWPWVTIYDDVKELNSERLEANGHTKIDIITGGYPCQPFSVAGKQKGEDDPRHVWPEMFRLIQELRPSWVIGENVAGHIKLGLDTVLENLESEGYSSRTFSISASSVGAVHQRESRTRPSNLREQVDPTIVKMWRTPRCSQWPWSFFGNQDEDETREGDAYQFERSGSTSKIDVAYTESSGRNEFKADSEHSESASQEIPRDRGSISRGSAWWSVEPDVGRVAHGVPKRVDRLKSLGNSLIPHIPYYIGKSILEVERNG
jgi:DNA (cytosine-5)-methyltransferase 1